MKVSKKSVSEDFRANVLKAMLHAIFQRQDNATNVTLQVAKTIAHVTPLFSQLAMQQNVALQVARKVELSSTFRKVARQVVACNMSGVTCNVLHSSSLRKLQEK